MERKFLYITLLTLLPAWVLACARTPAPASRRPNVVLICLDTVRADHLGFHGHARDTTPYLDRLAERSTVFSDASSTAGWTKPSVPSFLTGTYPCQHGVYEGSARAEAGEVTDLLPESALTLAEAFRKHGYRTGAFVHNAQLRRGNGFEQGFQRYEEDNWDAREIRWRGLDWIDEQEGEPFFLYLHFLDAHWPYPVPDEFATRFADAQAVAPFRGGDSKALRDAINDGERPFPPEERAALEALYDGAIAYLDSELERLGRGLAQRGLEEDTIVCIVADHGEEFGEHGKIGHGHGLWEALLHVPWLLHVPGRAPGRIDTPVSLIDLFPTLVAAAGLPVPDGLEGIDRLAQPAAERAIFAEHKAPDRYWHSLRSAQRKLQRRFAPPRPDPGAGAPKFDFPVETGTRWEAELALEDGELRATQLKPRDEELDDPPELKGRIEDLGADSFHITGISVRFDQASQRQTEPGTTGPELAPGLLVKVRGPLEAGVLRAERIKFYPPGEADVLELRGAVTRVEEEGGSGRIELGGLWVRFTPETELKGAEARPRKARLDRLAIAAFLELGAEGAKEQGYGVERTLYDLGADPAELAPLPGKEARGLDRELDELTARLVRERIFGTQDQKTLDPEALQELQDIGYR
jgi:arylsulfatase